MVTWAGTGPTRKQGTFFYFPLHPYIHLHPLYILLHPSISPYVLVHPFTSLYILPHPYTSSIHPSISRLHTPTSYYIHLHPSTSLYIRLHPSTSIFIHLHPIYILPHPSTSLYALVHPCDPSTSSYTNLHPLQGVPKRMLRFWNFLMIDSSNFQELSLTLSGVWSLSCILSKCENSESYTNCMNICQP